MTVFRHHNVRSPGQLLELTSAFQAAALEADLAQPMLVAADQEGGQLIALGDATTSFAGNMALGAVDDVGLTERVARAIALESRAMGVNVVYAPSLDLAVNPANPALGIRAFGDDPVAVGRHGAAFIAGLQGAGVAASAKHAPGMGDISVDTHHGIGVVAASRAVLDAREFVPFRAAFAAGARLAMSGHVAFPGLTGRDDLPATLSRAAMHDVLRDELGFEGVTISDALDMSAITGAAYGADGASAVPDVVAVIQAGIDLLLTMPDEVARARIEAALVDSVAAGQLSADELAAGDARIADLRAWLGRQGRPPALGVVGCTEHQGLAAELASRALTLVRDDRGLLGGSAPLLGGAGRLLAIMPRPADLTPADTSSTVPAALAPALRRYHRDVDELVIEQRPDEAAIAAIRARAAEPDLAAIVIGTIDGHRQTEQLALVAAVAEAARGTGTPVIAAALRGPWDIAGYPAGVAALATYSILPGSLDARAAGLAGRAGFRGRLPVALSVAVGR
jgi:beta-N-acetylhexosaminidase